MSLYAIALTRFLWVVFFAGFFWYKGNVIIINIQKKDNFTHNLTNQR